MDRDDIGLNVTCDCGHEFEVTLGRLKQDRKFVCPACGETTPESDEAIAALDDKFARLTSPDTIKDIGKAVGDELTRGLPKIKRPR